MLSRPTPKNSVMEELARFKVPLRDQPILMVVDSSLGPEAVRQVSALNIRNLVIATDPVDTFARPEYETEDARAARRYALEVSKERLHRLIQSQPWAVIISMYQEFIFSQDDLEMTPLPLNIHPSRPEIPGMSYDVGPLDELSPTYGMQGATLHYMTREIDDGSIIQVFEHEVPDDADYSIVRRANQHLCLSLLDWLCARIVAAPDARALDEELLENVMSDDRKWGAYISAQDRDQRLREIYASSPNHPALNGNSKFKKRQLWDAENKEKAARRTVARVS